MDRGQLMNALERCRHAGDIADCAGCPYKSADYFSNLDCRRRLMADAAEELKNAERKET